METVSKWVPEEANNIEDGRTEMATPATLKPKTQCYIATLLNQEASALWLGIDAMLAAEDELDTGALVEAAQNYRRARDERDAFCKWMSEQEVEG